MINIHKAKLSFTICAVYRPPSNNLEMFYQEFSKLLNTFNNTDHLVIAGDFNIDVMSHKKIGVTQYLDILSSYGLYNLINAYIRE